MLGATPTAGYLGDRVLSPVRIREPEWRSWSVYFGSAVGSHNQENDVFLFGGTLISIAYRILNRAIQSLAADGIFPVRPFGASPVGSPEIYEERFERYKNQRYVAVENIEKRAGFAIDTDWLNRLALDTQVTIKKSDLNWQHGRVLYAAIRRNIADRSDFGSPYTVFETGTARGFSAICAARALIDANQPGIIVTLDTLPHEVPMIWNVASDHHRGPISRASLLEKWPEEVQRIVFVQGWSKKLLPRLGLCTVDFAFLDAQHVFQEVMREYRWVRERQRPGAQILFDDVTPGKFDGVIRAVRLVHKSNVYKVEKFEISPQRGFAIASRS